MGFLASDIVDICTQRGINYCTLLAECGVHTTQIAHITAAADDPTDIARLPPAIITELDQRMAFTPAERARIDAAEVADTFLRLLYYHNYLPTEAMQKANAVYAAARRDRLAIGGTHGSIYPPITIPGLPPTLPTKRRGRKPKAATPAPLSS